MTWAAGADENTRLGARKKRENEKKQKGHTRQTAVTRKLGRHRAREEEIKVQEREMKTSQKRNSRWL